MEENIDTKILPEKVWAAWERFKMGQKGKHQSHKYEIIDIKHGQSFSILWKSLFVRLVFIHAVEPISQGSRISYRIEIRGPFAPFLRFLLKNKLKKTVGCVLRSFVKQLEEV